MSIKLGYKQTEIGVIPEDWEVVEIGNIISDMKSGLSRKLSHEDIGLPVLRSNNITLKGIDFNDLKYWYIEDPQGANTENYFLKDNDIIINFINSISQIGKVAKFINHLNRNIIYTTNLLKMTTTQNTDYILNLLQTPRFNEFIQSIAKPAVNQASFTTKDFKLFKISLPPLEEQKKIADILSIVDKKISFVEENINATEELKKGLMQKLLTEGISHTEFKDSELGKIPKNWKVQKLGELGESIIGLTYSPNEVVLSNGILVLRSSNIKNSRIELDLEDNVYVEKDIPEKLYVKEGDILICARNGSKHLIGKNALIKKEVEGSVFGAFMSIYRSEYSNFIFQLLQTDSYKKQINANLGATINQITSKNLNSFKFPFPPLEEQKEIAEILSIVDKKLENLKEKKQFFEELKKGLMQKLLTGEVRV